MHDTNSQKSGLNEPLDEFEVELSDLPPSSRSHYLLLRFTALRERVRTARVTTTSQAAPQTELTKQGEEDFEIEFSDLPPSARRHYLLIALKERFLAAGQRRATAVGSTEQRVHTRRTRRARLGQMLVTLGICAALLVLLLGNAPDLRKQLAGLLHPPAPTPTQASDVILAYSSVHIISPRSNRPFKVEGNNSSTGFGSLPTTCPQASSLERFLTTLDPPGLGGGPLWITGFSGPTAFLHDLAPDPPDIVLPAGSGNYWYTTIGLFIQKGYEGSIVLQGGDQVSGESLLFSDTRQQAAHFAVYLNLQDPALQQHLIANGPWEMLAVRIYLPAAGCYYLQANWSTQSWIAYFAAGN